MEELNFYKQLTGNHSVSLNNEILYLLKVKYKSKFSLSKWLQEKLTEEEIKKWIETKKKK